MTDRAQPPPPDRVVVVSTGRTPFEALVLFYCALTGTLFAIGVAPRPGSLSSLMPDGLLAMWHVMLLVGGYMGLVALWLQGRPARLLWGLRIELSALCLLAGAFGVYSLALGHVVGARGFASAAVMLSISIACLWRSLPLVRALFRAGG